MRDSITRRRLLAIVDECARIARLDPEPLLDWTSKCTTVLVGSYASQGAVCPIEGAGIDWDVQETNGFELAFDRHLGYHKAKPRAGGYVVTVIG